MLDAGLNTRVFQGGTVRGNFPRLATVFVNSIGDTGLSCPDRRVDLGYYNFRDGGVHSFGKQKFALNNVCMENVNNIGGNADKLIRYVEDDGRSADYVKDTKIYKGFAPYELQRTENGGVRRVPVQGAEKANYAVLKRTLADGDTVELTMKQAKNGKYEAVALKSTKGKTLAELPQVKEMLLKLDPLVKRFIKIAR